MNLKIIALITGLAFLSLAETTLAQGTLTVDGMGAGTLNGLSYTNSSFVWTINYSTANPVFKNGDTNQPVYVVTSSQLDLNGDLLNIATNGTHANPGLWVYLNQSGMLELAPMFTSTSYNILTIGTQLGGWDGVSAYTSSSISLANFSGFSSNLSPLNTDQGNLAMTSGSVSLVTFTGTSAVPEPSTLALAALGGVAVLWRARRK